MERPELYRSDWLSELLAATLWQDSFRLKCPHRRGANRVLLGGRPGVRVTGASSWWQAQSTEQKLAYLGKVRILVSDWSQTLSVDQRGILVSEFKKLNEQEGELRALQNSAFASTLARLRLHS